EQIKDFKLDKTMVVNPVNGDGKVLLDYQPPGTDQFCQGSLFWDSHELEVIIGSHKKQEITNQIFMPLNDACSATKKLAGEDEFAIAFTEDGQALVIECK